MKQLYNLQKAIAPHIAQFEKELENFKAKVFTTITENYELLLPKQKQGYLQIKPFTIVEKTEGNQKEEGGYEFWILIGEHTYALHFIIRQDGNIRIELNQDGRVKSDHGPIWCWTRFQKVEDDEAHEHFVTKIYSWLTAEEVFNLLGLIVEYIDVEYART